MNNRNEKALSRLSLAAFAIDVLVIVVIAGFWVRLLPSDFWNLFPRALGRLLNNQPYAFTVPVAFLFHSFVVEVSAGGRSLGRYCLGLSIVNESGKANITSSARIQRFLSEVLQLGTGSLRFNTLATYQKRQGARLCSDWVGTAQASYSKNNYAPVPPTSGSHGIEAPPGQEGQKLVMLNGVEKGKITPLGSGRNYWKTGLFVIGRSPQHCDLALLKDGAVSRIHCCICVQNNKPKIKDGPPNSNSTSTHGTFVNGRKISATSYTPLQSGDQIGIGNSAILFQ